MSLLATCPPTRLPAQVSVHAGVGARYTSTLVHDSIVSPIDIRPAIGLVLVLTASTPLDKGWTGDAVVDFSWATLRRHEPSRSADLGTVGTLAFGLALRHTLPILRRGFSGRIGIGGLKYLPSSETGVFREGSGSLVALGTLGVRYDSPLAPGRGVALEVRYDLHRFITPALRSVGFTSPRAVHRIALVVSAQALGTKL